MNAEPLPAWKNVFRHGFAPSFSDEALEAVAEALRTDDKRLVQGATTCPPPLMCVRGWPCEGACITGFAGWIGDGLETVGEVEEYFAERCFDADNRLAEMAACRHFLDWFDETPRDQMRAELGEEIAWVLAGRISAVRGRRFR